MKTFLGIDLKIAGQIILCIHIVENILLYLIVMFRAQLTPANASQEFIVFSDKPDGYKIGE
jgi:hypothetical protein